MFCEVNPCYPASHKEQLKYLFLKLEVFFDLQFILQTAVQVYTYYMLPLRFASSTFLEV